EFTWGFDDDKWEVSSLEGCRYIVARSPFKLDLDKIRKNGLSAVQKALDLASAHKNQTTSLSAPGDNYIVLREHNGRVVLAINAVFNLAAQISATVEVRDKDGNIKLQPVSPLPKWHRSLRYYRLSQTASDTYEAYRNLYLGFEALSEECFPRETDEREGDWMRRCFEQFHR